MTTAYPRPDVAAAEGTAREINDEEVATTTAAGGDCGRGGGNGIFNGFNCRNYTRTFSNIDFDCMGEACRRYVHEGRNFDKGRSSGRRGRGRQDYDRSYGVGCGRGYGQGGRYGGCSNGDKTRNVEQARLGNGKENDQNARAIVSYQGGRGGKVQHSAIHKAT